MTESGWSVEAIAQDRTRGSTYLSIRALEILKERARSDECTWGQLATLARELARVRPSMVVIANRIHRTMHAARGDVGAAEREARVAIERAATADGRAARQAGEFVRERRVFTLSRSETVTDALLQARPPWVGVAESRPGGEGSVVADTLRETGIGVTLVPDAAIAAAVVNFQVEVVLVGADAVLPSGAVVNKVGTRLLALAAREEDIAMYAVCAEDKVSSTEAIELEPTDTSEVPLFEVTPPQLFAGIITEAGVTPSASLGVLAQRLASYSDWMETF